MNMYRRHESGAVSLFLVVFAMLLITVVTLSFLRIMLADQQQAAINDLSKSAYDSSLAGTEDAKRALNYYRTICNSGDTALCGTLRNRINSPVCNEGLRDVVDIQSIDATTNKEVPVQQTQSTNDKKLDQAYTCVKMQLTTADYLGTLQANSSKIIPLKGDKTFNSVTIEWYSSEDVPSSSKMLNMTLDSSSTEALYTQTNWPSNRPSLLRTQFFQVGSSFKLTDFDSSNAETSNVNSLFFYPTRVNSGPTVNNYSVTERDVRKTSTGTTERTKCRSDLSGGGYACSVTLDLPHAVGESGDNRTAYLRLTSMYNSTHFRVSLGNGANFDGVQPNIDSTGRANEQYRRVASRVDLIDTNFPFPEAAVDTTGNFCKDFVITSQTSDFKNNGCTP